MAEPSLFFAYTAMISPSRIADIAPGAQFRFIAHLPETRLIFPYQNGHWEGALPSVRAESGNTVWGAVFEVDAAALEAISQAEADEGRSVSFDFKAVDREGKRHSVVTHVHAEDDDRVADPSRAYMANVVAGGRHWKLPMGWVAGLEEYVEDPLF